MANYRVKLSFAKLSFVLLYEFAMNVVEKMTGNPLFPAPIVTMAVLKACAEALLAAITAADAGGKLARAKMRQAANNLIKLLRSQARYVDEIAEYDEVKILSSGFHATYATGPASRPDFWVKAGNNSGEVLLGCKATKGAGAYIWQFKIGDNPLDETGWVYGGFTTQCRCCITGLESKKAIWFRHSEVMPYGVVNVSEPISITLV
jgi:hypothetical protein